MKPTHGSLFAGIDGFSIGFERAGFRTKWQVEIEPFAQRTLNKHWPKSAKHNDVKTFPPRDSLLSSWDVDCITGGFPCTDVSVAGKNAGIEGEHSGLYREFIRIIRLLRPRYAVIENSPAIVVRGLDRILCLLAESGYDAEW